MSKRDRLNNYIRARVRQALAELAADRPGDRGILDIRNTVEIYVSANITEPCRMAELDDIMKWRFRKGVSE